MTTDLTCAMIAESIKTRKTTAVAVIEAKLASIQRANGSLNAFTRVLVDEARRAATEVDRAIEAGETVGPLAGVPFAAKDLFDVAGLVTTAGAKLRLHEKPAIQDAIVVERLKRAGAILVGTLNMDEFAYGFATVNQHFGTTRNPHDLERLAGGSSGGSGASVAAGLVPLSLGSDTNGSIRVPASLCGIWGIRPGDGAIPIDGTFPFVEILDTVGPLTRTADDLATAYEILSNTRLANGPCQPRIARLVGWFEKNGSEESLAAVATVMQHLGAASRVVELHEAATARSASFVMTAAQGGALHLETLRTKPMEYDSAVRDRLFAGALMPSAIYVKADKFREHFRKVVDRLFQEVDILVAPTTPVSAPRIDQATILMDGKEVSARANLGLYTQPLSLAGIPVVSAPYHCPGQLPIGIQFATARGREGMLFELMRTLEKERVLFAHPPAKAWGES